MHNWFVLLALLGSWVFSISWFQPSFNAEIVDAGVFYDYGEKVVFEAMVQPVENVSHLFLFIRPEGESTRVESVFFDADGGIRHEYNARQFPLRPFAHTEYWFRIVLKDGAEIESGRGSFDYIDNRYAWQTLQGHGFQVSWYEGDVTFGQEALNIAQAGMQSAQSYVPVDDPQLIRIYIYASAVDTQKALQLSQQAWLAGHASPDLGVILISVPPGDQQQLEFERQLPHEIVHLMQYAIVGEGYHSMPVWLLEGTASLAELNPNPDYERVLKKAAAGDSLLPFSSLCSAFPREVSGAFLAYAESASFVRFLHENYGTSGLKDLMGQYKNGLGCEQGIQAAFGVSLRQLEYRWRLQSLRMGGPAFALHNLGPYLALLLLLLAAPVVSLVATRQGR